MKRRRRTGRAGPMGTNDYPPTPIVEFLPPHRAESGFDHLIGFTITEVSDEALAAELVVRDEHKQPFGIVHGGVYASIAESLASFGTAAVVMEEGKLAMGLSNQTSFLRPITRGTIHARARRRHRGRTTWVWEVDIFDDDARLCAMTRMTIAVREPPEPRSAEPRDT